MGASISSETNTRRKFRSDHSSSVAAAEEYSFKDEEAICYLEKEILGYKFRNRKLLLEALIHPSANNLERKKNLNYERLEHVGDSVLNLLVTRELYLLYPDCTPGNLTRLRAANVDNEKLARVAVRHGLHRYMVHSSSILDQQIEDFKKALLDYPIHSNGLVDTPKFLADIVESIVGAVYIDSKFSLDGVWKVFKKLLEPIISPRTLKLHPMTELHELCQKHGLQIKFVRDVLDDKTYRVDILVDNNLVGTATSGLKKDIVQNMAAKAALDYLKAALLLSK